MKHPFLPSYYNTNWPDSFGLLNIVANIISPKESPKEKEMEYNYTAMFWVGEDQSKVYQFLSEDVYITPEEFKCTLRRTSRSGKSNLLSEKDGTVECNNFEMTPAEFTICAKKIHQDYLKNLDILHPHIRLIWRSGHSHTFDAKAFTHTCYIHLPFEILYQRGNLKDIKITYQAC